eukprot:3928545-Prymnesium_polylepis.1
MLASRLLTGNPAAHAERATALQLHFSPDQVSAPSTPHPSAHASLPHARPRADIRPGLTLSCKRS